MPEVKDLSSTTPNLRRKLIRGAFAAPSLLTVFSGSAFAASSHLRGLVNANENPVDVTAIIEGQDTYARVQLYMVESTAESISGNSAVDPSAIDLDAGKQAKKPPKKPKGDGTGDAATDEGATEIAADTPVEPDPLLPKSVRKYYVRGRDLGAYRKSGPDIPNVGEWLEFDPTTFEKVAGVAPEGVVASQSTTVAMVGATEAQPSNRWVTVRFDEQGHIVGLGGSGDGAVITNSVLASATAHIVA